MPFFVVRTQIVDSNQELVGVTVEVWAVDHQSRGPVVTAVTDSNGEVDIGLAQADFLSFYGGLVPSRFFLRVTTPATVFGQPKIFTLGDSMLDDQLPTELADGFFFVDPAGGGGLDNFTWQITGRYQAIQFLANGTPLSGLPVQFSPGGATVTDSYGLATLRFHDGDGTPSDEGSVQTPGFSTHFTIPTSGGEIVEDQIEIPTATLDFVVRDTDDVGIGGATVELIDDEHMDRGTLRSQITSAGGATSFQITPAELVTFYGRDAKRHRIRVFKDGLIYDSNTDPAPLSGFFSDGVWTLFSEITTAGLTITAAAQFLDVVVVDQFGSPVLDAAVDAYLATATDLDTDMVGSSSTSDLGVASFRLFVPSPATTAFFFRVRRSGKPAVITRRVDIGDTVLLNMSGYFTTALSPGKSTLTIDVDALTSMVVEGRIVDDTTDSPIGGLRVNLAQQVDGQPRFTGTTNDDGYFAIVVSKNDADPFKSLRIFLKDDLDQPVSTVPAIAGIPGGFSTSFLELRAVAPSGSTQVSRALVGTLICSQGTSSGIRIDCFDVDRNGVLIASVVTRENGLFDLEWTEPTNLPISRNLRFWLFDNTTQTGAIPPTAVDVSGASFTLNFTGQATLSTALSATAYTTANLSPQQYLSTLAGTTDYVTPFLDYKAAVAQSIFVRTAGTGILLDSQNNSGELRRCQDCSSLMSRSAYILELVAFCDRTFGGSSLDGLTALGAALRQPLAGLSICDDEETVNQARVAVEVLRKDLNLASPALNRATFADSEAAAKYRRNVYDQILAELGTSTSELRAAASGDALAKARVARVLGISESDVASLYLSEEGGALTEHALETLFGLRATENDHNFSLSLPDPLALLPEPVIVTLRKTKLRALWLSLDAASSAPVIDPDVVLHSDIVSPGASTLLASRREWVDTKITELLNATGSGDQGRFNAMLLECPPLASVGGWSTFSAPVLDLIELGESTDALLTPVFLGISDFADLQRVWEVCVSPTNVDADEWHDVANILLTCAKRSLQSTWKAEEASANVSLSPEFVAYPVDEIPSFALVMSQSSGRADAQLRHQWESTLRQRTDTWEAATTTLKQAVIVGEEANMASLVDALVAATTTAETISDIENRLHIDLGTRGRRRTTRHILAVETLVSLLERARRQGGTVDIGNTSTLMDIYGFDDTWVWLGRYDSWRAAMQVFVYPEELIDPSWRDSGSYSFEVLRQKLLGEPYISPQRGRELFDEYRKLVKAQSSIHVTAAATGTLTQLEERPGRAPLPVLREVTFAVAKGVGGLEVSPGGWYLIHNPLETDRRGWQPLPQVHGEPIAVTLRKNIATVFFNRTYTEGDTVAVRFGRDGWEAPIVVCDGLARVATSTNSDRQPLIVLAGRVGETVRLARWKGTSLNEDDWHTIETVPHEYTFDDFSNGDRYGKSPTANNDARASKLIQALESETHINLIYAARGISTARIPVNFQTTTSVDIHVSQRNASLVWARTVAGNTLDLIYTVGTTKAMVRVEAGENPTTSPAISLAATMPTGLSLTNTVPTDGAQTLGALANGSVNEQKGILAVEFSVDAGNRYSVVRSQRLSVSSASVVALLSTRPNMPPEQIETRLLRSQDIAVLEKQDGTASNLNIVLEWGFWAPLLLARRLTEAGEYAAAWDWMSTIYRASSEQSWLFPPMFGSNWAELNYDDTAWLARPNDPFAVANLRPNAAQRVTLLAAVELLQRWGDSLYVSQLAEDVARARNLFALAAQILNDPAATVAPPSLSITDVRSWIPAGVADDSAAFAIQWNLDQIATLTAYNTAVTAVQAALNASGVNVNTQVANAVHQSIASRIASQNSGTLSQHEVVDMTALETAVDGNARLMTALARAQSHTQQALSNGLGLAMGGNTDSTFLLSPNGASGIRAALVNDAAPFETTTEVRGTLNAGLVGEQTYIPTPRFGLCVSPPQRLQALRDLVAQRLALISENLGPSGLRIWEGGDVNSRTSQTTSEFRYEYLVERARQALGAAQQLEANMISAVSQRDEEEYRLLKATQAASMGQINVNINRSSTQAAIQNLTVTKAQTRQSSFSEGWYTNLRTQGLSRLERDAIEPEDEHGGWWRYVAIGAATIGGGVAAIGTFGLATPLAIAGVAAVAGATALSASTSQYQDYKNLERGQKTQLASYNRRAQEWRYQEMSARHSMEIGLQQEALARIQINTQRLQLSASQLQLRFAFDELNFLQNKEASAELYAWMVSKLRNYYRNVLLEATSLARSAHEQLTFQRQMQIPNPIASDYWQDLVDPSSIGRNGITGSSRLLQDLTELERLARESATRRLNVRKTFSMRSFSPDQLIRLQQDGLLSFAPRLEDYDTDFPELSHRLIESVSFNVVGLTPSTGIAASVVASGVSKTQTEDGRSDIYVLRPNQAITFTGIVEQSGISTLNPQSEMLRPFEGLGVQTEIQLQIPRAANLWDLKSIADVFITVEYSALKSQEKYRRTIARLDSKKTFSPSFSLRDDFVDQWYDVLQSTNEIPPFTFKIEDQDFVSTLTDLTVQQARLVIVEKDDQTLGTCDVDLVFNGGTALSATGVGGLFSTRQFWNWSEVISQSPIGDWLFTLPDGEDPHPVRQLIDDERLVDIVLILEVEATTPAWPDTL